MGLKGGKWPLVITAILLTRESAVTRDRCALFPSLAPRGRLRRRRRRASRADARGEGTDENFAP